MSDTDRGGGGEVRINLFGTVPLPGEPGTMELELAAEVEIPDGRIKEAAITKKKRGKK